MAEIVTLKNGSQEAAGAAISTMVALTRLMDDGEVILFYELVEVCKNPNHQVVGGPAMVAELKNRGLMRDNGSVHETVRNIVLSAVEGEGLAMVLGNPVAAK